MVQSLEQVFWAGHFLNCALHTIRECKSGRGGGAGEASSFEALAAAHHWSLTHLGFRVYALHLWPNHTTAQAASACYCRCTHVPCCQFTPHYSNVAAEAQPAKHGRAGKVSELRAYHRQRSCPNAAFPTCTLQGLCNCNWCMRQGVRTEYTFGGQGEGTGGCVRATLGGCAAIIYAFCIPKKKKGGGGGNGRWGGGAVAGGDRPDPRHPAEV